MPSHDEVVRRRRKNLTWPLKSDAAWSSPDLNLSPCADQGRDIALRCPRRPAQRRAVAMPASFRNAYAAFRGRPSGSSLPQKHSTLNIQRPNSNEDRRAGALDVRCRMLSVECSGALENSRVRSEPPGSFTWRNYGPALPAHLALTGGIRENAKAPRNRPARMPGDVMGAK
jgi:hypothetical protein